MCLNIKSTTVNRSMSSKQQKWHDVLRSDHTSGNRTAFMPQPVY